MTTGAAFRWRAMAVLVVAGALLVACTSTEPAATPPPTDAGSVPADPPPDALDALDVVVDGSAAVATVDERFLSYGLDQAQVLGGRFWATDGGADVESLTGGGAEVSPYDLSRPELAKLLTDLAPAYLRIGGTASDTVAYDIAGTGGGGPPDGYELELTGARWDEIADFAESVGAELAMTVNGGPGPRGADGAWLPDEARTLVAHAAERGDAVVWSLGNEPNYFPVNHGGPSPEQFADDYRTFAALVREVDPGALVAGPSSAYWPATGELFPLLRTFLGASGDVVDIVTWHFYPQQSDRCVGKSRPASIDLALDPTFLDEGGVRADEVAAARDELAPGKPVWLQETGNAQCGGQVGLSDRYVASLWWVDQLGQLARRGTQVVVRWNVSGATYGLLAEPDLVPNPDYWASLLWKRLMGTRVLSASVPDAPSTVRVYAHCAAGVDGGVSLLAVNIDPERPVTLRYDGGGERGADTWVVTSDEPLGSRVQVNGRALEVDAAGFAPDIEGQTGAGVVTVPPQSYAFLSAPLADVPACR